MSICDSRLQALKHLLLLEVCLLDSSASPASSQVVVSSSKFVRVVILPLCEKDCLSGIEKSGWKRPGLLWEELVENSNPLQAPQRRRSFLGGSELQETNLCVSFVVCLTCGFLVYYYLLPLRSTWVCLSLCVGIITLLVIIY